MRPPWWPETEAWPPLDAAGRPVWWGRRRAMRRRLGCLLASMALVAVSLGVLGLWLLWHLLGLVGGVGPASSRIDGLAAAAGIVAIGAALIGAGLVARSVHRADRPLGDLVEAAGRIEAGDFTARVPPAQDGPRELRALGQAFNTMAARLETDETQRRRLLADVSHELRTPLAVIQGNLEALLDGVYPADEAHVGPILDETRLLGRLVDDLRTVALAESGTLPLHREPTDLAVLAEEVGATFRASAEAAGVRLEVDVDDDLPLLDLDPLRVREVLGNLVANALRYVSRGGLVRVEARTAAAGDATGSIVLRVIDDGPGIPPDLAPRVFERFARSADSRGSGLGLAIVRGIVLAHGGTIEAERRAEGGTSIRITLPNEPAARH